MTEVSRPFSLLLTEKFHRFISFINFCNLLIVASLFVPNVGYLFVHYRNSTFLDCVVNYVWYNNVYEIDMSKSLDDDE